MPNYDTTTVGTVANFRVEDITHKPKRRQGDMIKLKQAEMSEGDTPTQVPESVPESLTLERAITFFKSNSSHPTYGNLCAQTSAWLEELFISRTAKKSPVKEDNNDNQEG